MTVWEFIKQMRWYDKWQIFENDREVTIEAISASDIELFADDIPIEALNALELTAEKVDLEKKIIYCRRY